MSLDHHVSGGAKRRGEMMRGEKRGQGEQDREQGGGKGERTRGKKRGQHGENRRQGRQERGQEGED